MGTSINDVGSWEGAGGGGGVKNPEKLPTSFMDGPYVHVNKHVYTTHVHYENTYQGSDFDTIIKKHQ